jgi:general secretion pathway protein D
MLKKLLAWLLVSFLTLGNAGSGLAQQAQETPATPSPMPSQQPGAAQPQNGTVPPQPQSSAPGQPPRIPPRPGVPERTLLPPPSAPRGGMVSLNFNRADLIEIIHILAQQLGLTYTIDPEVKGTVTINSVQPLSQEDLLPVFHQVLRMNGAVAIRTGNIYRIMPIKDAKGVARPLGQSREDSFALQIVPVRFFSVAEMKKVLTPFLQPGGEIIEHPRGNFLVIMDLPSNIQRLMEIADLIDVQVFAGTRMEIYQPKVASAEELATEMTKVMQSFAASAPQPDSFASQFIALPRINQLLVISHSEAAWTYAKRWLDRIDVIAEGPGRRIFIYPVENSKATELADVLGQALGQPVMARREAGRTLQDLHRSVPGGASSQFGRGSIGMGSSSFGTQGSFGSPFGSQGLGQQGSSFATIPLPGQPAAPAPLPGVPPPAVPGAPRPAVPSAQQQQQARPEEQFRIIADPSTNSLIIYGTAQEFQNIKNILKELDIVPRQVLLDVLIAEVTLSDDQSFGIDYEIIHKGGDVRIFNREFGSRGSILTGILGKLPAAVNGITQFPGGVSGVVGTGSVRALINALQTDSRIKILSSPSVLASDNKPARIQIGSEEPVPTGTITQAVGTIAESTAIQYRNTGRIVTIIPQVNTLGLVNLQILAEVSQRGVDVTVGPNQFPSFDVRQAETTAVVQDSDTLAIGGIIADNKTRSRSGVPYLMNLPILGRFFGSTTDTIDRTELIMLITPHVIRNRDDSRQVTESFKKSMETIRNELERAAREKEKLQAVPTPEPKPAAPGPSGDQAPAPVLPPSPPAPSAAPGPSTQSRPMRPITYYSNVAPSGTPVDTHLFDGGVGSAHRLQALDEKPGAHGIDGGRREAPRPAVKPRLEKTAAYALTAFSAAEPLRPVKAAAKPAATADKPAADAAKLWMVQVAAFDKKRDAEALAENLRTLGYDAFVQLADVHAKMWHRVRVAKLGRRLDALDMQKSLKAQRFEQAFLIER